MFELSARRLIFSHVIRLNGNLLTVLLCITLAKPEASLMQYPLIMNHFRNSRSLHDQESLELLFLFSLEFKFSQNLISSDISRRQFECSFYSSKKVHSSVKILLP